MDSFFGNSCFQLDQHGTGYFSFLFFPLFFDLSFCKVKGSEGIISIHRDDTMKPLSWTIGEILRATCDLNEKIIFREKNNMRKVTASV